MINRLVSLSFAVVLTGFTAAGCAQSHSHSGADETAKQKHPSTEASFTEVVNQSLTDPELKDYELWATLMEVPPAFIDTVKHRHDCELFGYVLEGEIEIQLEQAAPLAYRQGQMFYEPRRILHSMLRNQSSTQPAKILVIQLIKKGRSGYIVEPTKQ